MTTTEHEVVVDLSALEYDLSEGTFYEDYDESWRLIGSLRAGIAELERLRAENRRLRRLLDEAQLRSIEARNPGIDIDQVKRIRDGR